MAGSPLLTRVRNRSERLRQYPWRMRPHRSAERHVVVGGAPRSGTTLLRRILDRHPGLRCGAETKLFVPAGLNLSWLSRSYGIPAEELTRMRRESASQGAFIDAFAARVRADAGKARWVEKTPMNIQHLDWIAARFPEVSIIHLVRDGRDVVCSMREHPDWRWVEGEWQKVLVLRPLEWYARRWVSDTAMGMRWRSDPRYMEMRYEDLVRDPEAQLRRLCDAIGEPADPAWLEQVRAGDPQLAREHDSAGRARPDYEGAISDASLERWRRDLDDAQLARVMAICGTRLEELGYPV